MLRHPKTPPGRSPTTTIRLAGIACIAALVLAGIAIAAVRSLPVSATRSRSPLPQTLSQAHVREAARVTQDFGWRLTTNGLELTGDEGATWSNFTPSGVDPSLIRAAYFYDTLDGWLVASATTGPASAELVTYRTADGGHSWLSSEVGAPSPDFADATRGQASIDFVDPNHGWVEVERATSSAFSAGDLFQTSDGGSTWSRVTAPAAGVIAFATATDGWLAGGVDDARLYSTHDSGQTWSEATPPLPSGAASAGVVYSLAARRGVLGLRVDIASNPESSLLYALDGQDRWQLDQTLQDSVSGVAVPVAVDGQGNLETVLNRGQETVLSSGTGGGATTVRSNLPVGPDATVTDLSFVSTQDGWAIVAGGGCAEFKSQCTMYSALYATSDSGATWTQLGGS